MARREFVRFANVDQHAGPGFQSFDEFVIPDLLGGSDTQMIGQTLWTEFFANKDWPVASAVAVVLVVLLIGPIAVYQHLQARGIERG